MIVVTGGTGFVGREVVRQLAAAGRKVRVLVRNPKKPAAQKLATATGCELMAADVGNPHSLELAFRDATAVVHLVGIMFETTQTYSRAHIDGTRNVLAATKAAGISRFVHMSAIGTRPGAASAYHRTKWRAEELVRASGLDWTIFRPSIIYGKGDQFVNLIAEAMRPPLNWLSGHTFPLINGGKNLMQPVPVGDVAAAFIRSLSQPRSLGKIYELGTPPVTFRSMVEDIAHAQGLNPVMPSGSLVEVLLKSPFYAFTNRRPVLLDVPVGLALFGAKLFTCLSPVKLLAGDHVRMLREDQDFDTTPARNDLGFSPVPFSEGVKKAVG